MLTQKEVCILEMAQLQRRKPGVKCQLELKMFNLEKKASEHLSLVFMTGLDYECSLQRQEKPEETGK